MMERKDRLKLFAKQAVEGNQNALNALISEVQQFVYNLSMKMLWHPEEAKDASQEILIRVVTHLSSFRGESSFETWVFRIAHNYLLNLLDKRKRQQLNFSRFAEDLAQGQNSDFKANTEDKKLLVEEVKIGCSNGMLQCLAPDSRMTYVLGEVLELNSTEGAFVQQTTPEAFRKRLSRARAKINGFTQVHCGLVNTEAVCRCQSKVDDAIAKGRIDTKKLLFSSEKMISAIAEVEDAAALIRSNPVYDLPEKALEEIRAVVSGRF